MKKLLLLSLIIILSFTVFSQSIWMSIDDNYKKESKINPTLISSTIDRSVVDFSFGGFYLVGTNTHKGVSNTLELSGASKLLIEGVPDLLKLTASIIIPNQTAVKVNVIKSDYVEYENIEIAPSKGVLYRNQNPDDIPFVYGEVYNKNEFYPGILADVDKPYIIRDLRGVALHTYPFQYNPVTKVLRVYHKITVEVVESSGEVINPLITTGDRNYIDREFSKVYDSHFLNYKSSGKYTPLEEAGGILVISYNEYMDAMTPYVEWKNQIGYHTEIVDVASIGSTPEVIKSYISDYYDNNDLTYILFVGDAEHIPPFEFGGTFSTSHSDNAYTYLVGQDHYPDAFIGRFSAQSVADVETQVQRTIEYEKAENLTDGWLHHSMGIARDEGEGQGHFGEADYQHMDIIRDKLLSYHYDVVYQEYDGNVPGITNTTATLITQRIHDGISMINYCNHGSTTGWSVANYNNNHVNALTNVNKLPFIWSVACVNGNFVGNTCFGETWLRATHEGQPTGAIATFMSTINQPWVPPMHAQDEFNDIIIGTYENNIKRTFGGIAMNGCMKMNDLSGASGYETTDAWVIFGDPSVKIRTNNPLPIQITHNPEILTGDTEIYIESDVVDAFISLTIDNEIIGTGTINENGNVTIEIAEIWDAEKEILVVATGYNRIPAFSNIQIIEELPELDLQALRIIDPKEYYPCTGNMFQPKVVVRNRGENTINSFELYYKLNDGDLQMYHWEGTILKLKTDTILLSEFLLEEGEHTFMFYVENPNNDIDEDLTNDTIYKLFTVEDLEIISDFEIEDFSNCNVPITISFTNLSENTNSYIWDFGDGNISEEINPVHKYEDLGVYTIQLTSDAGACGTEISLQQITIGTEPPLVEDQTICMGLQAEFTAEGEGDIFWYDDEELTNLIEEGTSFITPVLEESTSYYVSSMIQTIISGAKKEQTAGLNGGYFESNYRHGLVFNSTESVVLKSVNVFSNQAKNRLIVIEDYEGEIVDSITVFIPEGEHRIDLNLNIPIGEDFIIYGPEAPNLYREGESGSSWNPAPPLPYPYIVGDFIEIYRSTAGGYEYNYYYYFYDWEVEILCESYAATVTAYVVDEPIVVAEFNYNINDLTVEFINESTGNGESYWDFGDGNTSIEENPVHTYESNGSYLVTLIYSDDCFKDTTETEIVIVYISKNHIDYDNIKLYPNPANLTCNIIADFIIEKLEIIDISGRIIYNSNIRNYSHSIDINNYDSGLYFVKIYDNNNKEFIIRLMVE